MSDRIATVTTRRACRCGNTGGRGARFCTSCGAAIDDSPMLLGSSAATSALDDARSTGIDRRWLAAALAAIVAFVGWSVWSGSSASTIPENAEDDQGSSLSTMLPSSTTLPPATAATLSTATTAPAGSVPTEPAAVVSQVGSGGPLLGELTGLRAIFVQQPNRLSVLDLDSGELRSAPSLTDWIEPFVVSGDWLVARVDATLAALPLSDLDGPAVQLLPDLGSSFRTGLPFPEPRSDGRAWVAIFLDPSPQFVLVDLATGETIEEYVPPAASTRSGWARFDAQGEGVLVSSSDGGVYLGDGGNYRRVTEGVLIAADDERALIETCDERMICEQYWLDRPDWSRVALEVPPSSFDAASFVGGTDWMLLVEWANATENHVLFNVVTGSQRLLDGADHLAFEQQAPPISPDGRWMAIHDDARLVIVDLVSDDRFVIDGVGPLAGAVLLTTAPVSIS